MVCDYYICKFLYIYYNENEYIKHELIRECRYYNEDAVDYDGDEDNYDRKMAAYYQFILTP